MPTRLHHCHLAGTACATLAAGGLYIYSAAAPFLLAGLLFFAATLISMGLRDVDAAPRVNSIS